MPQRINGRPPDGVRKLNLRYRVDDPRYAAIEKVRLQLEHGQGTGVLLAALAAGAELMLERMANDALPAPSAPADAQRAPERSRSSRTPAVLAQKTPAPPAIAPVPSLARPNLARAGPASEVVHFSEGTRRQFEQFGEPD